MTSEQWITEKLADLDAEHQRRHVTINHGERRHNFATNDYLDFAHHPALIKAAIDATQQNGTGSGASRLVSGTLELHAEVEHAIACAKGYPAALLFGSGYLASIGVIPAIAGRGDYIFADRLSHACLLDGVHLSGAKLIRFRHNDLDDLKRQIERTGTSGRKIIITESVFSMDGDLAPLPDIATIAATHHAMLMVDEAHATGVFGPHGHGLVAAHALQNAVHITMCTFSKALGGYGAAVACSTAMRDWLINKSRSFIFTTAPPPSVCGAALAALDLLGKHPQLGQTLLDRATFFRQQLHERGFSTATSASQIVPVIIGDNETTMSISKELSTRGIQVGAIRPPTVPRGTARLRFSVTLAHSQQDLIFAADALHQAAGKSGWKR